MKHFILMIAAAMYASAALAQTPSAGPAPRMRPMPHMISPRMMPPAPMSQRVIGNKKTHTYQFATDKNLPASANRVMFSSVSAAVAAGYRLSAQRSRMIAPRMMPHAMGRAGAGQNVMPHTMPSVPPPPMP